MRESVPEAAAALHSWSECEDEYDARPGRRPVGLARYERLRERALVALVLPVNTAAGARWSAPMTRLEVLVAQQLGRRVSGPVLHSLLCTRHQSRAPIRAGAAHKDADAPALSEA